MRNAECWLLFINISATASFACNFTCPKGNFHRLIAFAFHALYGFDYAAGAKARRAVVKKRLRIL